MLSQSEGCRCKENGGWRRQRLRCWHCWERQSLPGWAAALPDTLYTDEPAAELRIASLPYLSARKKQGAVPADSTAPDTSSNVTLALFGVVPVKTVRAVTTARRTVQLCGTPFGVKLFSDGALVVAFSDRYTGAGAARIPPRRRGCGWGISSSRQTGSRCAAMRI